MWRVVSKQDWRGFWAIFGRFPGIIETICGVFQVNLRLFLVYFLSKIMALFPPLPRPHFK